jgi:hypothetical protein
MYQALLAEHLRRRRAERGSDFALAGAYAGAGDREAALARLQSALEHREPAVVALRIEPSLRFLRGDPRFGALARRLGQPGQAARRL